MNEEIKYPIGGYAPGPYFHKCRECGNEYQGDKRAIQCKPCALKDKEFYDALTPGQRERFYARFAEIVKLFFEVRDLKQENERLRVALEKLTEAVNDLDGQYMHGLNFPKLISVLFATNKIAAEALKPK